MESVRIHATARDAMIAHARTTAPVECCGLLIGTSGLVEECVPARNACDSPTRYFIDPAEHFAAIRRARATERQVIGAYHSHPRSAATPSPTDVAEANDPELLCVIVSLANSEQPEVRAYRIANGTVAEVRVVDA